MTGWIIPPPKRPEKSGAIARKEGEVYPILRFPLDHPSGSLSPQRHFAIVDTGSDFF